MSTAVSPRSPIRTAVSAGMLALLTVLIGAAAGPRAATAGPASTTIAAPATGIAVTIAPHGSYTIVVRDPAWSFGGDTGRPLTRLTMRSGRDGIGTYRSLQFALQGAPAANDAIRLYAQQPVVLFSRTAGPRARSATPFPAFTTYPRVPYALSYAGPFASYHFDLGGTDGPWLLFDAHADAYILSPASAFMAARLSHAGGILASTLDPRIAVPPTLPQTTLLVLGRGINRTFATWGQALTDLHGKRRPADDADVSLKYLGYWTDHGAAYYYRTAPARSYAGTLRAVRDRFQTLGLPLGYLQLDSWWYPKGPAADWRDVAGGAYAYTAASALFPAGLRAFQRQLGVPLIVHARWLDPASPDRARYAVSGNVPIAPRFWDRLARSLRAAGVATYEQDWLAGPATAGPTLVEQDAFLDQMARAMQSAGLSVQYSMPLPRHLLQSTLYDAVHTVRVSEDRFGSSRWTAFLYGARLAAALGLWPWSDVAMSRERANLLLATLSGGPVGVGDPLGEINGATLAQVVRADGVIVKPDAALVPLDAVYLADAQHRPSPMVAWTYSRHGPLTAAYVVAYARGSAAPAVLTPATLGLRGRVYVYDYGAGRGTVWDARRPFRTAVGGSTYEIVVPIGRSGIAFLGDAGTFVSLGRQRIARLWDDGSVEATVLFAAGERGVTVHGYAPRRPAIRALAGSMGPISYARGSGLFDVRVAPGPGGQAIVRLTLPPSP